MKILRTFMFWTLLAPYSAFAADAAPQQAQIQFYNEDGEVRGTAEIQVLEGDNSEVLWEEIGGGTGPLPSALFERKNLSMLSLANSNITDAVPDAIGNLEQLQQLYLHTNRIEGPVPLSIARLQLLHDFDVAQNQITEIVLPSTRPTPGHPILRANISSNPLVEIHPYGGRAPVDLRDEAGDMWVDTIHVHFNATVLQSRIGIWRALHVLLTDPLIQNPPANEEGVLDDPFNDHVINIAFVRPQDDGTWSYQPEHHVARLRIHAPAGGPKRLEVTYMSEELARDMGMTGETFEAYLYDTAILDEVPLPPKNARKALA